MKVSRIGLAPEVAEDFDRVLDHLTHYEVENPGLRIGEIIAVLNILAQNPLIGRLVANAKRELVIGRRSLGYVALYRYVPEIDTVFVLSLRSQRKACHSERNPAG
nr:type II toxin-antitoxin system RelE/ParE family toxin [Azoarcus taiwanensis]